ncbi:MAG TPA: DUF418 domain-containing protein [Burkholderiales bacterium]
MHQLPAAPATVDAAWGPTTAAERLALVDALRGFALLGILLVNVTGFGRPFQTYRLPLDSTQPWYDVAAAALVAILAEGKFYALFSLLFGLGLALQLERAQARGVAWRMLYVRRLLVLFGSGLVHGVFIWAGDILMLYAVLGFVLLLFADVAPRALMAWVVAIGVLFIVAITAGLVLLHALETLDPEAVPRYDSSAAMVEAEIAQAYAAYGAGSYAEITAQRIEDLRRFLDDAPLQSPSVLVYFLLGLYLGKRGVLAQPHAHAALLRRWARIGAGVGLPLAVLYAWTRFNPDPAVPGWLWWSVMAFYGGGLGLSLAYAGGLSLLWLRPGTQRVLQPLAAVGRLALSNYLLQSIVGTWIFYGYGLGLFGQVPPARSVSLALGIYLLQIPLSRWWLGRFRFGPAEWLWRSLAYGRRQPWRRG